MTLIGKLTKKQMVTATGHVKNRTGNILTVYNKQIARLPF